MSTWTAPSLLVLTDRHQASRPLVDVVAAAVEGGARAVILREKDLPRAERSRLAAELAARLAPVGGLLLVADGGVDPPDGQYGLHLAAGTPWPDEVSPVVGRSCHTADELARAALEGCSYVTVSPVHPSPSKPGYGPPLGHAGLARLARLPGAPPVYALGGVHAGNAPACARAGAAGVAVMGEVMRSARPDRTVAGLLAALERAAA